LDQVRLKEVITKADISKDGVLAAATSRKLDKAGYRLHEDAVGIAETAELRASSLWRASSPSRRRPAVW
jgi:hypothetical protein